MTEPHPPLGTPPAPKRTKLRPRHAVLGVVLVFLVLCVGVAAYGFRLLGSLWEIPEEGFLLDDCPTTSKIGWTTCEGRSWGMLQGRDSVQSGEGVPDAAWCADFLSMPRAASSGKDCLGFRADRFADATCAELGLPTGLRCYRCTHMRESNDRHDVGLGFDPDCRKVLLHLGDNNAAADVPVRLEAARALDPAR